MTEYHKICSNNVYSLPDIKYEIDIKLYVRIILALSCTCTLSNETVQ